MPNIFKDVDFVESNIEKKEGKISVRRVFELVIKILLCNQRTLF